MNLRDGARQSTRALGFERIEFKLATMPEQHLGTSSNGG